MEVTGGSSSAIDTGRANKMLKLEGEDDRISDLPDPLIQLILSFLPSTKQAIQTGILSKRWQDQWARVPVLIFDSNGKNDTNFSQFIDRTLTLHDSSKLKKFHVQYDWKLESDPQLDSKIRFATRKNVEELILHSHCYSRGDAYPLPKFLYNNASLIYLELFYCCLVSHWKVNWSCLKVLKLDCSTLHISVVENAVSGSPVLELLELTECEVVDGGVIASKSLKRLIFIDAEHGDIYDPIEISCPKLEELSLRISGAGRSSLCFSNLPSETIKNVLSGCLLLCSLELRNFVYEELVIGSYSLKKLVLGENDGSSSRCAIEISCPNLEELSLYDLDIDSLKLMKPTSLVRASFDFNCPPEDYDGTIAKQILEQLQQLQLVKELNIGSRFIKVVSDLAVGLSSPLFNCECLTLDDINFDEHLPGIVYIIRSSPKLEKLVIKLRHYQCQMNADLPNFNQCREKNSCNSDGTVFNCFVSQLKTVKITGLSDGDNQCKLVLHFVEFLLKNAIALEKMVLVLKDDGTDFVGKVSQKLSRIPKCSQHAIVELLRSN